MGFLPWEIQVSFPGESQLLQSRATQPKVHAGCFSVSIIHRTLDMDYGVFNERTDVDACDCARECTDTLRESALKVDSGRKKILATPENRSRVGGVPVRCSTN